MIPTGTTFISIVNRTMNRCLTDSLLRHYYCQGMCTAAKSGNISDLHRTMVEAALNYGIDFRENGDDFCIATAILNKLQDPKEVPDYTLADKQSS